MAVSDYDKTKTADVTSITGTPTLTSFVSYIRIEGTGTDSTGTGVCTIDQSDTTIDGQEDIAVYDENDNLLPYYWITFDTTNDVYELFVRQSITRDGTTQVKLAFGNGPATAEDVSAQTVWSSMSPAPTNVYDFGNVDNPQTTAGSLIDHSGNNRDETAATGPTSRSASGELGNAYDFDGTDDDITLTDFDHTGDVSWLFVTTPNTPGSNQRIIYGDFDSANAVENWFVGVEYLNSPASLFMFFNDNKHDSTVDVATSGAQLLAGAFDNTNDVIDYYVNGNAQTEQVSATETLPSSAVAHHIGQRGDGSFYWKGTISLILVLDGVISEDFSVTFHDMLPSDNHALFSWNAAQTTATTANATVTGASGSPLTAATSSTANAAATVTGVAASPLTAAVSASADVNATITSVSASPLTAAAQPVTGADATVTQAAASVLQAATASTANSNATATGVAASPLTVGSVNLTVTAQVGQVSGSPLQADSTSTANSNATATGVTASPLTAAAQGIKEAAAAITQATASPLTASAKNIVHAAAAVTTGTVSVLQATASSTANAATTITNAAASVLQAQATFDVDLNRPLEAVFTTPDTEALITTKDTHAIMEDHTFKEGDLADDLTTTLKEGDGQGGKQAIDLTNAQGVTMVIQSRGGTTTTHSMTVKNATDGEIKYEWQSGDPIETPGTYRVEFKIDWGSGIGDQTVPNDGYNEIEVEEDLE